MGGSSALARHSAHFPCSVHSTRRHDRQAPDRRGRPGGRPGGRRARGRRRRRHARLSRHHLHRQGPAHRGAHQNPVGHQRPGVWAVGQPPVPSPLPPPAAACSPAPPSPRHVVMRGCRRCRPQVEPNRLLAIMGSSGAGKTTLVRPHVQDANMPSTAAASLSVPRDLAWRLAPSLQLPARPHLPAPRTPARPPARLGRSSTCWPATCLGAAPWAAPCWSMGSHAGGPPSSASPATSCSEVLFFLFLFHVFELCQAFPAGLGCR